MFFIGIDLAWSTSNKSGIAILKGDRNKSILYSAKLLNSDNEIIGYINSVIKKENAIISIDAPLIVPNKKGRRLAEELIGKLFRRYNAGAHPSNRERLSQWNGKIRGEEISKKLTKNGFEHNPKIKRFEKTRKFFEVYPHPSMVVLFNLDSVIKYKAKPRRDYNLRWKEFRRYQDFLKSLENSKIPLILDDIIKKNVKRLKGQRLKDYEDLLDATFCAYLSYYNWTNPEKCLILGDMKKGYISTPVFERMIKNNLF